MVYRVGGQERKVNDEQGRLKCEMVMVKGNEKKKPASPSICDQRIYRNKSKHRKEKKKKGRCAVHAKKRRYENVKRS